jgi:hypothetical protein
MDTVVAELVSFFQALKSGDPFGYFILLGFVLTGLALTIVAVACRRIVIKRFQTASEAAQGNLETIAAGLRKRALEIKERDEGLRKRDQEERDGLKGFVEDANAELSSETRCSQQQRQVLKGSQRAMKGSVGHIITVGLKDFQDRMLQADFKVMTSVLDAADRRRFSAIQGMQSQTLQGSFDGVGGADLTGVPPRPVLPGSLAIEVQHYRVFGTAA